MVRRIFRVETDRLPQGKDSPRQVVLGQKRKAKVVMGRRLFRVESDRLLEGSDSPGQIVLGR